MRKKVGEKAPVDGIQISDLNIKNAKPKMKKIFFYSIKLADFYYFDSAQMVVNELIKKLLNVNH